MQPFTSRFQEALQTAQSIAVGKDSNYIEPAHVYLALLRQEGGAAASILRQAGKSTSHRKPAACSTSATNMRSKTATNTSHPNFSFSPPVKTAARSARR